MLDYGAHFGFFALNYVGNSTSHGSAISEDKSDGGIVKRWQGIEMVFGTLILYFAPNLVLYVWFHFLSLCFWSFCMSTFVVFGILICFNLSFFLFFIFILFFRFAWVVLIYQDMCLYSTCTNLTWIDCFIRNWAILWI